ncbi:MULTISPECIES: GNAT family N-acetyltransferase [unclassified Tolypothrix]|uniref:GNAT family N-acetyltransferase n=1 Tax=unclassified Tolypothrix TaxID=2649714 RepID=UPI0005EAA40D|nr:MULTISPECIES: GNAT family N-acetyltransferase [unclassified Tolypothrix]BAY90626.1 GCN5-related N-acetyltransferase [Microchaete diplosiphon NIES-3275]EKF01211.1 toxin-antitoxin system, toxin component, GNAT family [Tolypothrix sp. PCC 7601]MBE9086103.1 GNAT family N-acetyltransferase [Tolypothrix sp. LEGE 11397]UYD24778.1 GNAT family N-acetyltransferase [Tolypothrix sp. PCC 7712]UYD32991.1 GNAT family N-acetyltransferase [Tolypothrix sp. PCC 7601]
MNQSNLELPSGCILRKATSEDNWPIRLLVLSAKLDPTQLRWQQFWVIECNGKLAACGQLRNFDDTQELGSLVVAPAWRDRGLGSLLTQHLIATATQPLYLECLGQRLAEFYSRFGFVAIAFEELPRSLKSKFGLSQLGKKLIRVPVVFMHYPNS